MSRIDCEQQGMLPEATLPVPYLTGLFFGSFKWGQNNPVLHDRVFMYISTIHPQLRLTGDVARVMLERVAQPIQGYVSGENNQSHLSLGNDPQIPKEIVTRLHAMQSIMNRQRAEDKHVVQLTSPAGKKDLIQLLTHDLIEKDYYYLVTRCGRPRAHPSSAQEHDPFLSFVCHYGLLGNSTKFSEFDQMWRDIGSFITEGNVSPEKSFYYVDQLQKVTGVYNLRHPNTRVTFP